MCHLSDPINSLFHDAYHNSHAKVSSSLAPRRDNESSYDRFTCRLINNIFTAACLSCLLYQLYSISNMYFRYRVAEQISIDMPINYSSQSISLCLNSADLFAQGDKRYMKHANILNDSPSNDSVLIRAEYRLPESYELNECLSVENCTHKFDVSKFTYGHFVCYKFTVKKSLLPWDANMSIESLSVTPAGSGMIIRLWIEPSVVARVSQLKIAVHSAKLYPVKSFSRTKLIVRNLQQKDNRKVSNSFYSSQRRLSVDKLPPPHATMCRESWMNRKGEQVSTNPRTACLQECTREKVISLTGKLPFSVLMKEPVNLEIIGHHDLLTNETLTKSLETALQDCTERVCNFTPCQSRTVFTRTIEESGVEFTIDFIIPRDPNIIIKTYAILTLFEYLTYMMGTVSTYIGVAVIHLNPIVLFNSLKGKLNHLKGLFSDSSLSSKQGHNRWVLERGSTMTFADNNSNSQSHDQLHHRSSANGFFSLSRERFNLMLREDKHLVSLLSNINLRLKKLESKI